MRLTHTSVCAWSNFDLTLGQECIEEALAADGRPMSGLCQMVEIRDFLNQLHMDCQAKAQEISVAAKIRNDLTEEVNTLRINTRQMRKQVTNLIEQARKACQQYRIEEQIRSHVEALTHNRARMEIEAHKLQRRNASLVRERNDYVAEQVHLQKVITTYRKAGALTSPSDASDDD